MEGIIADARHAGRDGDCCQTRTPKGPPADAHQCRCTVESDCRQTGAFKEGIITDARHAGRNLDARHASAAIEGIIADARHAVLNDDSCNSVRNPPSPPYR